MRPQARSDCAVYNPENSRSLSLEFTASNHSGVQAYFGCDEVSEGYAGTLRGGVIAALLDGAITNCMFAHGIPAITAELNTPHAAPLPLEVTGVAGRSSFQRYWRLHYSWRVGRLRADPVGA